MRRTILTGIVTLRLAATACAADPLPIIPGAAGFGINTPAGSGRHLDVAPDPGLARTIAGHWTFDDAAPKGGTLSGDATLVKRGEGQALFLKGKGSLALPSPDGYVKPGAGFTVMAWVCLDGLGGFVAENRDEDGTSWELGPTAAFGGKWRFFVAKTKRERVLATWKSCLTPDTWRHITGVYHDDGRAVVCFGETGRDWPTLGSTAIPTANGRFGAHHRMPPSEARRDAIRGNTIAAMRMGDEGQRSLPRSLPPRLHRLKPGRVHRLCPTVEIPAHSRCQCSIIITSGRRRHSFAFPMPRLDRLDYTVPVPFRSADCDTFFRC